MLFKIDCMRTDRLYTPIGIENKVPCFSWHLNGLEGISFDEYKVKIRLYDTELNILWESVGVCANETETLYRGDQLETATYYLWDVVVYKDGFMECSNKTFFMTGMLYEELDASVWISHPDKTINCPVFRKEFEVNKEIKSAKIISSALGNYDFYIDGKRVGNKIPTGDFIYDELKPGFTEPKMHVHYQTYDVTHMIGDTKSHAISAVVSNGWWLGEIVGNHESHIMNPNRQGKKNAFIIVLLLTYDDNSIELIRTDNTWKASSCSKVRYSDIYDGEMQDLRMSETWAFAGYDDKNAREDDGYKWYPVVLNDEFKGIINSSCGHSVYVRKDLERIGEPIGEKFPISLSAGKDLIIDFGQNISGVESIMVEGRIGTKIQVKHAETLMEDGSPDYSHNRGAKATSVYLLNGCGKEHLQPTMTYYGFQYIVISADKPITIYSATGIVLSAITSDMEKGRIVTDNARINQLVQNAYWSQIGNFGTVPTDCPQRDERHAFTGDVQIYCKTACYYADVYQYIAKWILEDVTYLQHTNGAYPSTAPQSRQIERYGMAGWSDGGVIIPYYLYQMTGNMEILKKHYPSMQKFIKWLISNNGPGKHYGDWACPNEEYNNNQQLKEFLADAYYCIVLKMYSEICQLLWDGLEYSKEMASSLKCFEEVRNMFEEKYIDNNGIISELNDYYGKTNQTACVYILYFDLIRDEKKKEQVIKQLKENLEFYDYTVQTGFLGTPYLLKALSKCDMSKEAYRILNGKKYPSWLYSVDSGANTIWEYWDGVCSRNHFAYGSVVGWLYENAAGIQTLSYHKGITEILLKPEAIVTEAIHEIKACCEIKNGSIFADWKITDDTLYYNVQIPDLTRAKLVFPYPADKKWVCSEERIVSLTGTENLEFRLNPGTYKFKIFCIK